MLPSTYRPIISLHKTSANYYFDTTIVPTNKTDVNIMFGLDTTLSYNFYAFGSRKQNSNTSAEQLNLLFASTSYFGYGSTRSSFSNVGVSGYYHYYFSNKANTYTFNDANTEMKTASATAATFTGTQTMYAMALNNAGTVNHGTTPNMIFYFMSIRKDNSLVSELYPCINVNTNEVGLYDTKRNVFLSAIGTSPTGYDTKMSIISDGNGRAFIRMPHGEYTAINYLYANDNEPELEFGYANFTVEAEPNEGYVFSHWEDYDGNFISSERVLHQLPYMLEITGTHNKELHAVFIKKTTDKQNDSFILMGIQYGVHNAPLNDRGMQYDHYTLIRSFDVKEDGLTRTVSTIVCDSLPSTYQVDMPIGIFSSKGEPIWAGRIESINDKTLSCREALSFYDEDFIFVPNASWNGENLTNYALPYAIGWYTAGFFDLHTSNPSTFTDTNECSKRRADALYSWRIDAATSLDCDNSKNVSLTMPLITETSVSNLEDYLIDIFDSTGYGVVASIKRDITDKAWLSLEYYYPNRSETLPISDNAEVINNVEINIANQENTTLVVFNSTGNTCRGVYGMQTDGTITDMVITEDKPITSFIGYTECRTAVVLSDDKIETLLVQYLSNSKYNHIITFDVDLTSELYEFSDFTIGRNVRFYYGNKVYESVITGKEYALAENEGQIKTMKVTLGKVRKKLTDRINLSKASKKR